MTSRSGVTNPPVPIEDAASAIIVVNIVGSRGKKGSRVGRGCPRPSVCAQETVGGRRRNNGRNTRSIY